ncbi:MAG: hypothetical protein K2Q18_06005 [Bdellovibrionales bacterium]|nr:hypothetical protein [Bdellovibrionales bacterium]
MEHIIYQQNKKAESIKLYFLFGCIIIMIILATLLVALKGNVADALFIIPLYLAGGVAYFLFKEFIDYGADITISSTGIVINEKIIAKDNLIDVGQCKNRHLIYFIINENGKETKYVGFNRFTHKELLILNDKTELIEKIKKIMNQ